MSNFVPRKRQHDALTFFSWLVQQLEQGRTATVSAEEARGHLERLRRYVAVLEKRDSA